MSGEQNLTRINVVKRTLHNSTRPQQRIRGQRSNIRRQLRLRITNQTRRKRTSISPTLLRHNSANIIDPCGSHRTARVRHDEDAINLQQMTRQNEILLDLGVELATRISDHLDIADVETENLVRNDARIHAGEHADGFAGNTAHARVGEPLHVVSIGCHDVVECFRHDPSPVKDENEVFHLR